MFRLGHLSDPHLPPPAGALALRDLFSKRALSAFAWRRKHVQHDPAVLAAIVADIAVQAPDHLAVTGDLMNFATDAEAASARAWLSKLGDPAHVTLSPGNHDALVKAGNGGRLASLQAWFGETGATEFPYVRRRGDVAIVNLRSAAPTAPHLATGQLGEDQRTRLEPLLDQLGREGLFRVVLLHHPPVDRAVSNRKRLVDAPELRAVIGRVGCELVLHGHAHEALVGKIAGPRGPVPVLGVPSASTAPGHKHAAARWHLLEIASDKAITVVARGLDLSGGAVSELGRYRLPA